MNHEKAYEDVQLIKDMLTKTRQNVIGSGKYFILWGYVVLAGILSMYFLLNAGNTSLIWPSWTIAMLAGIVLTVIFSVNETKQKHTFTFIDKVIWFISIGFGISFFMAAFVFPYINLYSFEAIGSVTGLLAGTFLFILGCICRWKILSLLQLYG